METGVAKERGAPNTAYNNKRLQQVLAAQEFPAERWELIVVADLYGADALTKSELHALPAVRFRSLADVLHAVERVRKDALDREQSRRSA